MLCRFCGEQWDLDSIHELVAEENPGLSEQLMRRGRPPVKIRPFVSVRPDGLWFDQPTYEQDYFNPAVAKFRSEGCAVFNYGKRPEYCKTVEPGDAMLAQQAAIEVMGDDHDGIEAMIQDVML